MCVCVCVCVCVRERERVRETVGEQQRGKTEGGEVCVNVYENVCVLGKAE